MGLGMWITSCPEAMSWGFWDLKKALSWDLDLDEASWFSELTEARPVGVYGMPTCWLSQWVESWWCTISQHRKKLCFSLLMLKNLKLKKVNKCFVPEPISCFSDSYILWTYVHFKHMAISHIHILVVFLDLYYTSTLQQLIYFREKYSLKEADNRKQSMLWSNLLRTIEWVSCKKCKWMI